MEKAAGVGVEVGVAASFYQVFMMLWVILFL